jgi:hypothetical protein
MILKELLTLLESDLIIIRIQRLFINVKIKFFRFSSFELDTLRDLWNFLGASQCKEAIETDGCRINIGDGVKQRKSG